MRADFVLDYDVLTVEQPHKMYLMARLISGSAPIDKRRRPLNLSLVIDRSGSMAGDKINYTKQASQILVQNLGAQDTLSIVLYNEGVETLLAPEAVQRKDLISQRIDTIKAGGTTNLSGGWLEGCNYVAQNREDERINRVILMSDGHANRGVTQMDKLVALAQQKANDGISTTTMGLGEDFNEDLMIAMAHAGGGAFYFIESPEVAPLIFQEELQGLLSVVGQNLVISVEMTDDVLAVHQLNAYPMHSDGRRVSFRLGDVFGDEVKALLLELSIPALKEVGQKQIGVLRFEYDELLESGSLHRVLELPININIAPEGRLPAPANEEVSQSVLLLKAAQARREAVSAADKGNYQTASEILRNVAQSIEDSQILSAELQEERSALLKQADDLEQGEDAYDSYSRKMMSTQSIYTMTDKHSATQALRIRDFERQAKANEPQIEKQAGVLPTLMTWNDRTFPLKGDLIRMGRAPQNEIVINARGVSRFHCQLKREGDQLILEDLNSTNGTMVEGVALKSPYTLSVGDEIYLCNERLVFHNGDY
jgi:Ca-activated chloride channel homolog